MSALKEQEEREKEMINQDIHVEIDAMDEAQWHAALSLFHDTSVYQTYTYGKLHWPGSEISHLVVKSGETVIAIAQVAIKKLPVPGFGIAYVFRGPLWRTSATESDPEVFRTAINALIDEYVIRRKLFLRVIPNEPDWGADGIAPILAEEGFVKHTFLKPYRTFILDLSPSLEELRSRFGRTWRSRLKQAEKETPDISIDSSDAYYEAFTALYDEMRAAKNFIPGVDILEFGRIHSQLPDQFKFLIAMTKHQNKPVATIVCALTGTYAIYLLGASNPEARDMKASFVLHWELIKLLKEKNVRIYDLGGIDPDKTPGPYHFKSGMGGIDVEYVGTWDRCANPVLLRLLRMSDRAYIYFKMIKSFLKNRTVKTE